MPCGGLRPRHCGRKSAHVSTRYCGQDALFARCVARRTHREKQVQRFQALLDAALRAAATRVAVMTRGMMSNGKMRSAPSSLALPFSVKVMPRLSRMCSAARLPRPRARLSSSSSMPAPAARAPGRGPAGSLEQLVEKRSVLGVVAVEVHGPTKHPEGAAPRSFRLHCAYVSHFRAGLQPSLRRVRRPARPTTRAPAIARSHTSGRRHRAPSRGRQS